MTLSKVDLANQVENQLPQSLVADNVNFRNIIINGDMSIAQRGTSVSSITTSSYNTLDRFKLTIGSAGTWTQSQSTDVPSGQGFAKSLKMDCTTANASLSAGAYFFLEQQIEGQNLQYLKKGTANAESLTLSFWVKSNKTGTYIAELRDTDNDRAISKSYTISSASTWEKKTITYDGDTSGAFTNDNNTSLRLEFHLGAGSSYQSGTLQTSWGARTQADEVVGQVNLADSTSNEWYITGVQLEVGTTASDFEFLSYDVNLQRCLRYFEARNSSFSTQRCIWTGDITSGNTYHHQTAFGVTKRVEPTASISVASDAGFDSTTIGLQNTYSGKNMVSISCTANVTQARGYFDYEVSFDAEL